MASVAVPISPFLFSQKKAPKYLVLDFIDSIESTWKGHEKFAMWLVQNFSPKVVVDLGFDRGLSTLAFGLGNKGHVFGIDWFEEGNYAEKSFALDTAFQNISNAVGCRCIKNVHLIIGPFSDVKKSWKRAVDILHIDHAHTYSTVQEHYENWLPFCTPDTIFLIHDVLSQPEGPGRFFHELNLPKALFSHSMGLGVASANASHIDTIRRKWYL